MPEFLKVGQAQRGTTVANKRELIKKNTSSMISKFSVGRFFSVSERQHYRRRPRQAIDADRQTHFWGQIRQVV